MSEKAITTHAQALAAVKQDGSALHNVPEELKTVEICVWAIINKGWRELKYSVPDELREETLSSLYGNSIDKPAGYYADVGMAYLHNGQYDQAIQAFTEAIKHGADNFENYCQRACACEMKGEYGKAIENFTDAIKIDPNQWDIYINRGHLYLKKGQHEEAIDDFNKVIAIQPENAKGYEKAKCYEGRGQANHKKGLHEQAISDFTLAIKLLKETAPDFSTPPTSSAYEYRGMVYADKGEYELAIKDFETTLSMNPNHETAKKELLEVKTMLASSERLCDNLGEGYKVFIEFLEKEKQERENSD